MFEFSMRYRDFFGSGKIICPISAMAFFLFFRLCIIALWFPFFSYGIGFFP